MKKKNQYIDDGHTIYNMDIDGMPHRRIQKHDNVSLTKKERRAMIKAAYAHYLPVVFGTILCFGLAVLLMYFWLC